MPHCVIHCPSVFIKEVDISALMTAVYHAAESSGLFKQGDIKVRIMPTEYYLVGHTSAVFAHLECSLLSGRTLEQRQNLSQLLTKAMCESLPGVETLSVEVREIVKSAYCNREALEVTDK
ncbi:5-carboxymethyl-2-hydroxymuconate Delta-isomerase [Microbulbifer sp. GL-2]|uniref:5-carboxymethyl-2-hydroxymuconate Delta-isomerase n=1 Tax=Microbulbifer sp. GL-2 TaxID=2591606 RepID=UPI001163821F|nr:5-carboxymethyl-2-hydroxymuconate Delta-isomerase [Microbulbifer sp. GL-2]BBM03204.1 hypothetical protein GL2_32780 [Microbulbifer sp. GL-2]